MCKLLTMHAMSAKSTNALLDYNTYKHCLHTLAYCIYSAYMYIHNLASHIEIYPVMPPVLEETKISVF